MTSNSSCPPHTEAQVFRDNDGYVVKAGGHWRRCGTRDEAIQFLSDAGLRPDADWLLLNAIWVPAPVDFEFRPVGRRSWILNGIPVTVAGLRWALREAGFSRDEMENWLRIEKLFYEVTNGE